MTDAFLARRGSAQRLHGRRVVVGLFFFPRGGSAQVARALSHTLAQTGWEVTLAAGSLGQAGEPTHAPTFFGSVDLVTVDYSPDRQGGEGAVPFQPSHIPDTSAVRTQFPARLRLPMLRGRHGLRARPSLGEPVIKSNPRVPIARRR